MRDQIVNFQMIGPAEGSDPVQLLFKISNEWGDKVEVRLLDLGQMDLIHVNWEPMVLGTFTSIAVEKYLGYRFASDERGDMVQVHLSAFKCASHDMKMPLSDVPSYVARYVLGAAHAR